MFVGVFGVNFNTEDAFYEYLYHSMYGSTIFVGLCVLSVLILAYFYWRHGFYEMLTNREVNRHVAMLKSQAYGYNRK